MASSPQNNNLNGANAINMSSQYLDDAQYEVRVAGRFKMGKKIGSGSFGEIFLAIDLHTNKEVAIKFVSRPKVNDNSLGIQKSTQAPTY
jgi:serine/threonine protein kinase